MNNNLANIKNFRGYLLKQIDDLSLKQLNFIPPTHHNNIIWNLAHMISVQQAICYVRAGVSVRIPDKFFSPYLPGTKPAAFVEAEDVAIIRELFLTSIETFQFDLGLNLFQNYSPSVMIPRVYGVEVNNIDAAIDYLVYHEGLHGGYILSMKHLV